MIEVSGARSVIVDNGSGCGSWRPNKHTDLDPDPDQGADLDPQHWFLCTVQAEPNTPGPACKLYVQEITHAGRIPSTNQSGQFSGGISGKKMYKKVAVRGNMAARQCCIESSVFFICSFADFINEYKPGLRPEHKSVHCSSFSMKDGALIKKKIKFSSYIRNFKWDRVQSDI